MKFCFIEVAAYFYINYFMNFTLTISLLVSCCVLCFCVLCFHRLSIHSPLNLCETASLVFFAVSLSLNDHSLFLSFSFSLSFILILFRKTRLPFLKLAVFHLDIAIARRRLSGMIVCTLELSCSFLAFISSFFFY